MTATITDAPRTSSNNGTASHHQIEHDDEPQVVKMTISPTMALNWLEHANTHNRNVSYAHVKRLARDMKHGHWVLTHEGIAFDPRGVLLDGQHRLWAIVEADVAVTMHVWFNITAEALSAINHGKPRTLTDLLHFGGQHERITSKELAVLRAMLGSFAGPVTLTTAEASKALDQHHEAITFAMKVLPAVKGIGKAGTRAVIARAYYSADHADLADFGRMLTTGVVSDASLTSVILLRQHLLANLGDSYEERRQRYGKTQRALLAFLKRQHLTRLYAVTDEHFPLPGEDQCG